MIIMVIIMRVVTTITAVIGNHKTKTPSKITIAITAILKPLSFCSISMPNHSYSRDHIKITARGSDSCRVPCIEGSTPKCRGLATSGLWTGFGGCAMKQLGPTRSFLHASGDPRVGSPSSPGASEPQMSRKLLQLPSLGKGNLGCWASRRIRV